MMRYLGDIVDHEGTISLRATTGGFWPLNGPSGFAVKWRDTFGEAKPYDIGKRVYALHGELCMESAWQRDERAKKETSHG